MSQAFGLSSPHPKGHADRSASGWRPAAKRPVGAGARRVGGVELQTPAREPMRAPVDVGT